MAPTAFRSLAGLADTAGGLVFPTLHATQPTLYGRPAVVVPDLPTSAANARSVVFGDIEAAYTVPRVSGLGLQRLGELYSENGQVGYRSYWRLDGRPVDLSAAIILRHSAS
jgi:HK97 family phage major capsid protein